MLEAILHFFDLFGTFIFALTGAIKGVKNRLDFLGVIVFAITVGTSGGIIRDLLLGSLPVSVYENGMYVFLCFIGGALVFILSPKIVGRWPLLVYFDALGLGVFTALGCAKAEKFGVNIVGVMLSGVLTAVGGGVLRDVFSKEVPAVFVSGFYASASVLGALCYVFMSKFGFSPMLNLWSTALITIVLRIIGYKCHFKLPVARMAGEEKKKDE